MSSAQFQINVDFDVFKEITVRRATAEESENDVLRKLFGLGSKGSRDAARQMTAEGRPWVSKGVTFPHATEFRATYKGEAFEAHVDDGALLFRGKRYTSPSRAAMDITEHNVNGWVFWECRMPGTGHWRLMDSFRRR